MKEIEIKRRTLPDRIIYTIGQISKVCHDDGLFQAQRLGLVDSLIDDAESAVNEIGRLEGLLKAWEENSIKAIKEMPSAG